jgi:hypothetical protein
LLSSLTKYSLPFTGRPCFNPTVAIEKFGHQFEFIPELIAGIKVHNLLISAQIIATPG